jgi:hypothetical protein
LWFCLPLRFRSSWVASAFLLLLAAANVANILASASLEMDIGTAADFRIGGRPDLAAGDPKPNIPIVDARYFRTMEMPVILGRSIAEQTPPARGLSL